MNLKKLGIRIKQQREKRRLRQLDIANALQVSSQAVSKWERGENAPDISLLLPLAQLLDVAVEWLLADADMNLDTFQATVLCTSLNGFAEKSKNLSPRDLATWINSLFFSLTEIVLSHSGVPVKYVGDGFLAFFTGENSRQRAIDAAIQTKKITNNSDLVIALNYGPIFLGTIGHPDYSSKDILGDTVNTCFLIMPWVAQNCHYKIGLTKTVQDKLKTYRKCGEVKLIDQSSVDIFELIPSEFASL